MTDRESLLRRVQEVFEPLQPVSDSTIELYKSGYCDEESSVGDWLQTNQNVEDYDFNPALVAFLNKETALRILPTILLGALNDPRLPSDHKWLYWNMKLLASLFDDSDGTKWALEFRDWFTDQQLVVFSDVLGYLSSGDEWSNIAPLLATGSRSLTKVRDYREDVL